ncbi:MAG: hypothetical protein K2V38_11705 [Gemmataceae bacterium]|nr:hypothetical protein [Gemmataceae bacterium]
MGDRVWQVPQDQFVAVWNGAASLEEASMRIKEIVSGNAPGWAVLQRALELRKAGVEMQQLVRPTLLRV